MLSLAIAFVCLVPLGDSEPSRIPYFDKYVHILMFGTLTFVWIKELSKQDKYKENAVKTAVMFCLFYGILIELFQEAMNYGRSFESHDIYADAVGIFAARFLFGLLKKKDTGR